MRVLLTGAAGFIGTAIGDQLTRAGHEVVGVDLMLANAHGGGPHGSTAPPHGVPPPMRRTCSRTARATAPPRWPSPVIRAALGSDVDDASLDRPAAREARTPEDPADSSAASRAGLGLAIVKGIVEAHRGRVEVTNTGPDGAVTGCRFVVRLPLTRPAG